MLKDTPPAPSRRERQSAERAERILRAAAFLFAEKGFHRTTTREIAEAADVAEGTLYNYFQSKNDLLFGIMAQIADGEIQETRDSHATSNNARQDFANLLAMRKRYLDENTEMLQAVFSEILADSELRQGYQEQILKPTIQSLENDLALHVQAGQIRPIHIPAAARVLAAINNGLFILKILDDPLLLTEWEQISETLLSIIFEGLASDSSRPGQEMSET